MNKHEKDSSVQADGMPPKKKPGNAEDLPLDDADLERVVGGTGNPGLTACNLGSYDQAFQNFVQGFQGQ